MLFGRLMLVALLFQVVDEAEMWQQYDRMKELGGLDPSNPSYGHDDRCDARSNRQGRTDYWNGRSAKADYPSTSCRYRRAHMDEDIEERGSNSAGKTSTYWMRQLEKFESSNPNRFYNFLPYFHLSSVENKMCNLNNSSLALYNMIC